MKAVILAAGEATRLGPLRHIAPKPLLPVASKPTVQYVIDNIVTVPEIDEIIVAMRYSDINDRVKNYFNETQREGVKIYPVGVDGWETGGDLKNAAYKAKIKSNEDFIAAYGDIITKLDLKNMIRQHKEKGKLVTMALFSVPEEDKKRFGIAVLNNENEITEFIEKPTHPEKIKSNLANAGYYALKGDFLEEIPYGIIRTTDQIIPRLVERHEVMGFEIDTPYWLDIGTEESYDKASAVILGQKGIIAPPNNDR